MEQELKLPRKSLFKVEELCGITGVRPYVLRFWETEFSEISPLISASGQKFYEVKDIKVVSLIKKLLFEEKLTIQDAKSKLPEKMRDSTFLSEFKRDEEKSSTIFQPQQDLVKEKFLLQEEIAPVKELIQEIFLLIKTIKSKHNWI